METAHSLGARHACRALGMTPDKLAYAPETSVLTSATGDDGRAHSRTSVDPRDQTSAAFSENDRHLLRDPANSSSVQPVGSSQSLGAKSAAAHKLHGRITFRNLNISVENRKGSVRHWYDPHADKHGRTIQKYPYGYIRMTEGMDGDHVDCYVGPNETASHVYVITTNKPPKFTAVDEQKTMLGFDSAKEAKAAFLAHFDNPQFFRSMVALKYKDFERKVLATRLSPTKKIAASSSKLLKPLGNTAGAAVDGLSRSYVHGAVAGAAAGAMFGKGDNLGDRALLGMARGMAAGLLLGLPYAALRPLAHKVQGKGNAIELATLAATALIGAAPYAAGATADTATMGAGWRNNKKSSKKRKRKKKASAGPKTPGDSLALPYSSLVGARSIKGGNPEDPADSISRSFHYHDDPTDTTALDGAAAAVPSSPAT